MGDWIQKVQDGFRQLVEFIKEAWQELQRVHWPTRKETYAATLVVIIVVILFAIFLALIDLGLAKVIQWIIG